ncbi:MAG: type IV pilus assembly protein PilM, partial [Candidatus Nealsonbacteria bacterium]|nr:type IV pilus assembly protein PilM [Candidatus Nealsonbacteria bacterium]
MLDFFKLKPEAFGLDISDLSMKIVNLKKRKDKFSLACFGETMIKPGIINGGEIQDEKELIKIIKTAIVKAMGEKIKTKYVVASLPEEKAFLQVIQMPRLSEDDLKSAIIYEAENYIPLPIEKVYLDFQIVTPLQNHLDHLDVLIAALPKQTIDPYVNCLKSAGLKSIALEIESLSLARALIKNELVVSPCLLIDLGATRTSFIIFSGSCLRFTSSIPISSATF